MIKKEVATITAITVMFSGVITLLHQLNLMPVTTGDLISIEHDIALIRNETSLLYNETSLQRLDYIKAIKGLTEEEKRKYSRLLSSGDNLRAVRYKLINGDKLIEN